MRKILLLLVTLLSALISRSAPAQADRPKYPEDAPKVARTADEIARIEARVRAAPSPKAAAEAIPADLFRAQALKDALAGMRRGEGKARTDAERALTDLRLTAAAKPDAAALARIKRIKQGAEYRTAQSGTASNWFAKTLDGFARWWRGLMDKISGRGPNVNAPEMPNLSLPSWLIYVVWVLLAGVILAAAWPLIRLIRFRIARRKRKAKGILEEEPERTKSEYLSLAERLAAEGDFRGAIRMSYLAALKRFDEARVARFDRGETNWEHLARIRSSATLPDGLDFRPATAAFDHYWYGHRPALRLDYERFVGWYDEVDRALLKVAA